MQMSYLRWHPPREALLTTVLSWCEKRAVPLTFSALARAVPTALAAVAADMIVITTRAHIATAQSVDTEIVIVVQL